MTITGPNLLPWYIILVDEISMHNHRLQRTRGTVRAASVRAVALAFEAKRCKIKEIMMKTKSLLTVGILVWVIALSSIYFFDNINIDKCLDSGGSFNYSEFKCDFETTHNELSYFQARAPRIIGISLAIIIFISINLLFNQKNNRSEFKP